MRDILGNFQVWSAGLETWTDVEIDADEFLSMERIHEKSVNDIVHVFFKDNLGRWFRFPLGDSRMMLAWRLAGQAVQGIENEE